MLGTHNPKPTQSAAPRPMCVREIPEAWQFKSEFIPVETARACNLLPRVLPEPFAAFDPYAVPIGTVVHSSAGHGEYLGHASGGKLVCIQPRPTSRNANPKPVMFPAYEVHELHLLEDDLSAVGFRMGFYAGQEMCWDGARIGKKSQGQIPDDYSRGLAIGFSWTEKGLRGPADVDAYNYSVRHFRSLTRDALEAAIACVGCILRGDHFGAHVQHISGRKLAVYNRQGALCIHGPDRRWLRQPLKDQFGELLTFSPSALHESPDTWTPNR